MCEINARTPTEQFAYKKPFTVKQIVQKNIRT